MKTVEIVTMPKGWHVTRRYCGQNKGAEFFPFDKGKSKKNEKARDKFIKEWMGE